MKQNRRVFLSIVVLNIFIWAGIVQARSDSLKEDLYKIGILKPRDTVSSLKVGDKAPDFVLPSIRGFKIPLSHYLKSKNVVLSFVPAAWTPVCSLQWPEYDNAQDIFDKNDTILIGISVDNIPTLHSWTRNLCGAKGGLWFPVCSDFFPHGAVAKKYGVLRSDGVSERALFVIDKGGIIRYVNIHDINEKPSLKDLEKALESLQ
jgi:peroxiredoxin (alkyl hydroperoxide reductase subunit C)